MRRILPAMLMLAPLVGCAGMPKPTTSSDLVLYDHSGKAVGMGELTLPAKLPRTGDFDGDFKLHATRDAPPQLVSDQGKYAGHVGDQDIYFDLNPNAADAGTSLRGQPGVDSLSGHWYEEFVTGPQEMGTFTLQKKGSSTRPAP